MSSTGARVSLSLNRACSRRPYLTRCPYSPPLELSHTVNLLGNLPLPCLDVLLVPKVQPGSIEYMGVNVDAVDMLLEFMEKTLDRVRRSGANVGSLPRIQLSLLRRCEA